LSRRAIERGDIAHQLYVKGNIHAKTWGGETAMSYFDGIEGRELVV
jgi:hypothetical protein